MMNAAVIGCGLIGHRRIGCSENLNVTVICDTNAERARRLACAYPAAHVYKEWSNAEERLKDVDIVFVATPHASLSGLAIDAIRCGKHVFIEKPGARSLEQLQQIRKEADVAGVLVRIGYNHRYHRAFRKARHIVDSGLLGKMMYVRGRYGHGGRTGYDTEWRMRQEGGGELLDQGTHLIDLARWFLGEFTNVQGVAESYYWEAEANDNAFMLLRTEDGKTAQLHASCTEWKNLFSFEIFGRFGKLEISGLGGSYGVERLTHYRMLPEMGPPVTEIFEWPMADDSWGREVDAFLEDIHSGRQPEPGLDDAEAALRIVETLTRK